MTERNLRPREKRRASTLLNNSVVYDNEDTLMFNTSKRGSISKEKDKDKEKDKESKKVKNNKKIKTKRFQESNSPVNPSNEFDFGGPQQDDSDEGEGIFVIDDPDVAFYQKEYNSDEERRKRTAQKQERENEQLRMEEGLKKKKKKRHANVTAKKYYQVPTDVNGNPIMPIEMRGLTIHSLGKIVVDRKKFHAKRYIWPIGFKSSRVYCSMTNLNARCEYSSEIVDGDSEPKFIVTCYEDPKNPIVIEATTASGAWAQVGKRINDLKEELTGKRMFTQLSGPEMFGFSHPTIAKLIQELPNAEMCDRYIFQEPLVTLTQFYVSLPTAQKKGKRSKKKSEGDEYDEFDEDDDEEEDGDEFESDENEEDDDEDEYIRDDRGRRDYGRDDRRDYGRRDSMGMSGGIQDDGYRRGQSKSYMADSRDDWEEEEDEQSGTLH